MAVLITSSMYYPNVGGVESHLKDFADYLRRQNIRTHVLTVHPKAASRIFSMKNVPETKSFEKEGSLEIHRMNLLKIPLAFSTITLFLNFALRLPFFLMKHKEVKVLHAHCSSSLAADILIGKMFFGKGVFYTQHTPLEFHGTYRSRILKWCLNKCDAIFSISKQVKKDIVEYGVPEGNVVLFRNWTDLEKFKPIKDAKKKLGLEGRFVVHFSGRFFEYKGVKVFAEAYKKLNADKDYFFMATGNGPMESYLKESIPLVKTVSYDELPTYYSAADLFVIPSTYVEGFARVVIEALACGIPVIGSKIGSIPEEFDETVGVFFEPGNVEQLAGIIKRFHDNPKELAKIKSNVRPYAEKNYSERNAQLIIDNYCKVAQIRP